jgi:hypothetical protein
MAVALVSFVTIPWLFKESVELSGSAWGIWFNYHADGVTSVDVPPIRVSDSIAISAENARKYCGQYFKKADGSPLRAISLDIHHRIYCGNFTPDQAMGKPISYRLLPGGQAEYFIQPEVQLIGPAPDESGQLLKSK